MDRKKRLFNRVLIVSGASAVLLFAGYVFFTYRSPRKFFVPEGFSGWVTVRFEKPNAAPLPEKDGATEFHIPANGILETSSKLQTGWSRDDFYYEGLNGTQEIPKSVDCGDDHCRFVHDYNETNRDYSEEILALPEIADTLYWDGARIAKKGNSVNVRTGRKTMLQFWVSEKPEPYFYVHDSLPLSRKVW